VLQLHGDPMSADVMGAVGTMLRLRNTLRLDHAVLGANVGWEMDKGSAEALVMFAGGRACDVEAGGVQALGIPVTIVERPGIRLVFTVTDR
jgi:hypothetical protein